MSVKIEASGRRSVQVDVEVPGTPEEVWKAIATGPGISSWFVPTEFEERDGKTVAVTSNFGPGMQARSAVTAWDPPRMFAAQGEGWGGSPPIATEWSVEARAGGVCRVRVVTIGTERLERRAALDGARGCPRAQRLGRVRQPESVRRPAAA